MEKFIKMRPLVSIWITDQFSAMHRWKDAPLDVSFLREYHRHLFFVKIGFQVTHNDRQLEFFQMKRKLRYFLDLTFTNKTFDKSCEMIAQEIGEYFESQGHTVTTCEVSEDGENGALISYFPYHKGTF